MRTYPLMGITVVPITREGVKVGGPLMSGEGEILGLGRVLGY